MNVKTEQVQPPAKRPRGDEDTPGIGSFFPTTGRGGSLNEKRKADLRQSAQEVIAAKKLSLGFWNSEIVRKTMHKVLAAGGVSPSQSTKIVDSFCLSARTVKRDLDKHSNEMKRLIFNYGPELAKRGVLSISYDHASVGENTADESNDALGVQLKCTNSDGTTSSYLIAFQEADGKDAPAIAKDVAEVLKVVNAFSKLSQIRKNFNFDSKLKILLIRYQSFFKAYNLADAAQAGHISIATDADKATKKAAAELSPFTTIDYAHTVSNVMSGFKRILPIISPIASDKYKVRLYLTTDQTDN